MLDLTLQKQSSRTMQDR